MPIARKEHPDAIRISASLNRRRKRRRASVFNAQGRVRMTERLEHKTVVFAHPFTLNGVEGTFPPGAYVIETTQEQLDSLPSSDIAYRRVSTTILLPSSKGSRNCHQLIEVSPADLEAALTRDAQVNRDET